VEFTLKKREREKEGERERERDVYVSCAVFIEVCVLLCIVYCVGRCCVALMCLWCVVVFLVYLSLSREYLCIFTTYFRGEETLEKVGEAGGNQMAA